MRPVCPECGQVIPPPLIVCTCGHLELGHELNPKGQRTYCWFIGPEGRCRCRKMEAA